MAEQEISPEGAEKLLGMSDAIDEMLDGALNDEEFQRLARQYKEILKEAKESGEEPDQDRLKEIGEKMDERMKEL